MQWQALGFKDDPLSTSPITRDTLSLYTGHEKEVKMCLNALRNGNSRIVVEGPRGVGTTSFSNYIRFSLQEAKIYFTTSNEIRVDPGWQIETLLAVIVANIVREIELFGSDKIIKDNRFLNAKALSTRIAETYRSFGVDAFSVGFNYGKSAGVVTQPMIIPAAVLGHHIEDLVSLIKSSGYQKGILIQLNNLDVGEIHEEGHLKYLFNALRDYSQMNGLSWLFVGDVGLRKFIAQQVDRLDDIITFEVMIGSLKKEEFKKLIQKRVESFRTSDKVEIPVDIDVFLYLFEITDGRLRYIFGLIARLMTNLNIGEINDYVTLEIAKPMLIKLARLRIQRNDISPAEEQILRIVVKRRECLNTEVSQEIEKSVQYVGRTLNKLSEIKLIQPRKHGKKKYYTPSIDAVIAYSSGD